MSIVIRDLSFSNPNSEKIVLDHLNLSVEEGKANVLLGANGAGKSTILKNIAGILKGSGQIDIGGKSLNEYTRQELSSCLSYMTQEEGLRVDLEVIDVVLLGLLGNLHINVRDDDINRAEEMLEMLGIGNLASRHYSALSGGQRRLVDAAQTLIKYPKYLLMDEATANLDIKNELEILDLISAYTYEMGATSLLSLHDLSTAARYGDNIILLKNGVCIASGKPETVMTEENLEYAFDAQIKISKGDSGIITVYPLAPMEQKVYQFRKDSQ